MAPLQKRDLLVTIPGRAGLLLALVILTLMSGCSLEPKKPLPILGTIDVPYTFTNQEGAPVSQSLFASKVYVADFFFTSCPTICPIMKSQMLRVYDSFSEQDNILLLSHTIDPDHDSVEVLHDYAERLEISAARWHLVTGPKMKSTTPRTAICSGQWRTSRHPAASFIQAPSVSSIRPAE